MLTVAIVDPDSRHRQNLERLLKSFGVPFEGFESGEEYLTSALVGNPHVVALSLNQIDIDGFDLIKLAVEQSAAVAVFAVLDKPSVPLAVRAIKLGADDVFERPVSVEPIVRAARLGARVDKSSPKGEGLKPLSNREKEVLDFLLAGKNCRDIANALKISVRTAEAHRRNIFQKTGVHSQVDLVRKMKC